MSKNPQIGTCPCPFTETDPVTKKEKRCTEAMAVRRFECKAPADALARRRKGGKLYADCPTHGRIGFDGIAGTQEYLLNASTLWDAKKLEEHDTGAKPQPQPEPAKPQRSPAPTPAKTSAPSTQAASTQSPQKRGILDF